MKQAMVCPQFFPRQCAPKQANPLPARPGHPGLFLHHVGGVCNGSVEHGFQVALVTLAIRIVLCRIVP